MDFRGHPFWWLITVAVVAWYSTITIYVAIKGSVDVREMLGNLRERDGQKDERKS